MPLRKRGAEIVTFLSTAARKYTSLAAGSWISWPPKRNRDVSDFKRGNLMALRVYNTLTRQKEDFKTVQPGKVGMYVCGPTVYKPSHVGHMVGPVIFDTIKRFLTYSGYQVTFVVNITDVDDKLIVRARESNTTVKDLAERMTAEIGRASC